MQKKPPKAGNSNTIGVMAGYPGHCLSALRVPGIHPSLYTSIAGEVLLVLIYRWDDRVREVKYHGHVRLSAYLSETYTEGFRTDRISRMCFKIIQREGPGRDMDETQWATLITVEDGRRARGLFSLLNV